MTKYLENDEKPKIKVSQEELDVFLNACGDNNAPEIETGMRTLFSEGTSIEDLVNLPEHAHMYRAFFHDIFTFRSPLIAQHLVIERFFQNDQLPMRKIFYEDGYPELIADARRYAGLAATYIYFKHLPYYVSADLSRYKATALEEGEGSTADIICRDLRGNIGEREIDRAIETVSTFIKEKARLEELIEEADTRVDIIAQLEHQTTLVELWADFANKDLKENNSQKGASFSCWKALPHIEATASLLSHVLKYSDRFTSAELQTCKGFADRFFAFLDHVKIYREDYWSLNARLIFKPIEASHKKIAAWQKADEKLVAIEQPKAPSKTSSWAAGLWSVGKKALSVTCFIEKKNLTNGPESPKAKPSSTPRSVWSAGSQAPSPEAKWHHSQEGLHKRR
jgi:hypothetical protein